MRRGTGIRTALLVAVLVAPPIRSACAQSIQSGVSDSATGRPVAGGIVQLIGPHDSVYATATTSERGTFALPVVPPGPYRIKVLRIGSRAWTSPVLSIGARQQALRQLTVASEPVMLAEIVVTTSAVCRSNLGSDSDVATLWEEARKALKLAEGTMADRRFDYRMTVVTRHSDPTRQMTTEQRLGRLGTGAWPILSAPAENLAAHGYVQPADSVRGPRYYGPDANVFFSDAFMRTHCFRAVAPPKKQPGLIGVGFEPQLSHTLPDIKGVMWLDRQTAELQRIEFEYTGLWRWVPPRITGGELKFVRLDSGAWIITGWRMTAPIAAVEPLRLGTQPDESVFPYFGNKRVKLGGFLEEEGQVEEVRAQDSAVVWRVPTGLK